MRYQFSYSTVIGEVKICEEDGYITKLSISDKICEESYEIIETSLIKEAYSQLSEYLLGERQSFDLPLKPKGSLFQTMVWNELAKIPYGKTYTYKEIAIKVGNDKACRAVGGANNKNPIPIFIPCHRVIGSNGSLVGFAIGLDMKKFLLDLEKNKA